MTIKLPFALAVVFLAGCARGTPQVEPTPEPAAGLTTAGAAIQEPPAAVELPYELPGVDLDTVRAGRFDNGKMWTFEYPPLDYFRETYGFAPDAGWFERARLGALRLPNCSASFVSPHGLVLTNHHCAREHVSAVSEPGEALLDNGFYASALSAERPIDETHVDQLIEVVDVTDEVFAALADATTDVERAEIRETATTEIGERLAAAHGGEDAGIITEVIALWDGARYSAYIFKRYEDVRLVAAPELGLGQFGGDPDNFTYPRYSLDFSLLRVYGDDGEPLRPEHFFKWSGSGVSEGDAVFVIGNPGSTSRLQTVAQLEYRRRVLDKAILDFYTSRAKALETFYAEDSATAEALDIRNEIFGLQNSQKAYRGIWGGLFDPVTMARRRDSERSFLEAVDSRPELAGQYGDLVEGMAGIQTSKEEYRKELGAFLGLATSFEAAALMRGLWGFHYLNGQSRGAPAAALEPVKGQMLGVGDQPLALQRELLSARLVDIQRHFGAGDPLVQATLGGISPTAAAEAILTRSVLADSTEAAQALEAGTLEASDPAVQLVAAFWPQFINYQNEFQALTQQEEEVAAQLGRARFEVYGTSIPPDATFSLRIADGVVTGYEYNGTIAPPLTTYYGLYDHYNSYGPGTDWDLPERWLRPAASFDLSTPLNFVFTADIIGGNSGSPIVNPELEIVGVVFDGNIESLPGDYIYDATANRAVAVDGRGILEALDEIYDADRLVLELTTGQLVESEAEADRVGSRR